MSIYAVGDLQGCFFSLQTLLNAINFNTREDEIWFVTHIVSYEQPRHYYHVIVVFDEDMNLLRYSAPFKFEGEPIEYCLSIVVENEQSEIVGSLQLSFLQYLTYQGGVRAQIEAVRINEKYRNKGLGTQFFLWAIEKYKSKVAHVVQLTTDSKRPEAKTFYLKLGFIDSHEGMKLYL